MSELYLMTIISKRDILHEIVSQNMDNYVDINYITLGQGTISSEIKDLLYLESKEKAISLSIITQKTWEKIKEDLERKIHIDIPDTAIAFISPLSSIGGRKELNYFVDGQSFSKGRESVLKNTETELLMIICNQGYSDQVMDAARKAGAGGGTVIHAQGTGQKKSEKFLGVSLATEKDIIYIVVKTQKKNEIMSSIMKESGLETPAKAICFSLPVTDVAGIKYYD